MFMIIDAAESVDPDIQGPQKMKHVGGSITMTTSTDLVASLYQPSAIFLRSIFFVCMQHYLYFLHMSC